MPLNNRYTASEMHLVLKKIIDPIEDAEGNPISRDYGGTDVCLGFSNKHAVVLFPVTDNADDFQLQSITIGINQLSTQIKTAVGENKKIIIPVVELQKTFGLFQRQHFVTLTYEPSTNIATLIDSRPWIVSFLYPTKSMETMLRTSLENVLGTDKIASMEFKKIYQGVQHNDTHCGAWTAANIMGLAGVSISGDVIQKDTIPKDTSMQATAFTRDDEITVINNNITLANNDITSANNKTAKISKPNGWFQKLLIRLGFAKYKLEVEEDNNQTIETTDPLKHSHTAISDSLTENLPKPRSLPKEYYDQDFEVVEDQIPDASLSQEVRIDATNDNSLDRSLIPPF